MMKSALSAAFAALLGALPVAAIAQDAGPAALSDDPVFEDLKCLAAAGALSPDAPENLRQAHGVLGVFYMGKLLGRDPGFDIAAADARYGARLETLDLGQEVQGCFDRMSAATKRVQAEAAN